MHVYKVEIRLTVMGAAEPWYRAISFADKI
jgi:hypothetical protein